MAEGKMARGQATPDELRTAIALWEAALPHWRAASDPAGEAETLRLIGSDLDDLGDDDAGRERLLRAERDLAQRHRPALPPAGRAEESDLRALRFQDLKIATREAQPLHNLGASRADATSSP